MEYTVELIASLIILIVIGIAAFKALNDKIEKVYQDCLDRLLSNTTKVQIYIDQQSVRDKEIKTILCEVKHVMEKKQVIEDVENKEWLIRVGDTLYIKDGNIEIKYTDGQWRPTRKVKICLSGKREEATKFQKEVAIMLIDDLIKIDKDYDFKIEKVNG